MVRRTRQKRYIVTYCSERHHGRYERIRAKRDLKRGVEPQPRYATGKFWTD